jgi:hypothetical protein
LKATIDIPQDLKGWALAQVATSAADCPGVFKVERTGIYFVGINDESFRNCYGWLPLDMPYDDPYQAIPQGDTSWFIVFLTTKGFKEVRSSK